MKVFLGDVHLRGPKKSEEETHVNEQSRRGGQSTLVQWSP